MSLQSLDLDACCLPVGKPDTESSQKQSTHSGGVTNLNLKHLCRNKRW